MEFSKFPHFCSLLHILIFTFFYTINLQFYLSLGFSNETDRLALLDFKDGVERSSSSTDLVRGVLSSWNNSVHFCQWRGVICGRKHRQRVVGLNLRGLGLTGSLPPSVGNLTFLRSIDLSLNKLHGPIPREVSHLFRLRYLNLSGNAFGGKIPTNMTHCQNLRVIAFHRNELIGKIPIEFGSFPKLTTLTLSVNNITGGIPTSLGNLSSLQWLSIAVTSVDGKIPSELGRLKVLEHLQLSENKLSGNIPPAIYNLSSLRLFFITLNRLEGRLPPDLGLTLPRIQEIAGGGNQFTGPIPVSLSNASEIETFDFGSNRLTGTVTANLGSLPRLCHLNLGDNDLSNEDETDGGFNFLSSLISLKATDGFSSENLIGVGSYGSVYKGILSEDGNERVVVAVKVLNLRQEGASKTFVAECNSLRNIRHRNQVKILTVCSGVDYKGNDFKALVFEFMANGSLENWLHPDSEIDLQNRTIRNLNLLQRLNAAIDVASALDYLHHNCVMPVIHRDLRQSKICQTSLVHRDLKPSDILLDEDMNAHVGDFGLAKFLTSISTSFGQNQTSSSTAIKVTFLHYLSHPHLHSFISIHRGVSNSCFIKCNGLSPNDENYLLLNKKPFAII